MTVAAKHQDGLFQLIEQALEIPQLLSEQVYFGNHDAEFIFFRFDAHLESEIRILPGVRSDQGILVLQAAQRPESEAPRTPAAITIDAKIEITEIDCLAQPRTISFAEAWGRSTT